MPRKIPTTDCTAEFLSLPTPWEAKENGVFPVLSRRPAPKTENVTQDESGE